VGSRRWCWRGEALTVAGARSRPQIYSPSQASQLSRFKQPARLKQLSRRVGNGSQAQHPGYCKTTPDLLRDELQTPDTPEASPLSERGGAGGWAAAFTGEGSPCGSPTTSSRRLPAMGQRPLLADRKPRPGALCTPLERLLACNGQRDGFAQLSLMGSFCPPLPYTAGAAPGQAIR